MDSTTALNLAEDILTQAKAGTLEVETGNYWYMPETKRRVYLNTTLGFLTYLEIWENGSLVDRVFESLTIQDPETGDEDRFGDQWSPLISLSTEEKDRFTNLINAYLN